MKINRIIFLDKNGTSRAHMATRIFLSHRPALKDRTFARGLVVAFEEPVNPKAQAVMASDGIDTSKETSKRLEDTDIIPGTIIFAIDGRLIPGAINRVKSLPPENIYDICVYTKEELEIMEPYGGSLQDYGICYESMKNVIKKLIEVLEDQNEL